MIAWATRMRKRLEFALEALLGAVAIVLLLTVLWQIASRNLLGSPSRWTDEASTVLLVWMTLLGTAVGFARQAHLGLDYLMGKLKPAPREAMRAVVFVVVGVFAIVVLMYGGSGLARSAFRTGQLLPALQVSRGYFYLPLPISGLLILLVAFEGFLTSTARCLGKEGRT